MTATETQPVQERLPVLLGLREMVDLFPDVTQQTVYRWRVKRGNAAPALPPPALTVSGTPMWPEDVVLEFAEHRKLQPNKRVLARIRKAQGH